MMSLPASITKIHFESTDSLEQIQRDIQAHTSSCNEKITVTRTDAWWQRLWSCWTQNEVIHLKVTTVKLTGIFQYLPCFSFLQTSNSSSLNIEIKASSNPALYRNQVICSKQHSDHTSVSSFKDQEMELIDRVFSNQTDSLVCSRYVTHVELRAKNIQAQPSESAQSVVLQLPNYARLKPKTFKDFDQLLCTSNALFQDEKTVSALKKALHSCIATPSDIATTSDDIRVAYSRSSVLPVTPQSALQFSAAQTPETQDLISLAPNFSNDHQQFPDQSDHHQQKIVILKECSNFQEQNFTKMTLFGKGNVNVYSTLLENDLQKQGFKKCLATDGQSEKLKHSHSYWNQQCWGDGHMQWTVQQTVSTNHEGVRHEFFTIDIQSDFFQHQRGCKIQILKFRNQQEPPAVLAEQNKKLFTDLQKRLIAQLFQDDFVLAFE